MSSDDHFARYAEAVRAFAIVDDSHRKAVRRAVEASTAATEAAKAQAADQQRMYDRTGRQAADVGRQLAEIQTVLDVAGHQATPTPAGEGRIQPLAQIRAEINDIARKVTQAADTAESLLRSQSRLSRVPHPPPTRPTPEPTGPAPLSRVGIIMAVAMLAVVVITILVVGGR